MPQRSPFSGNALRQWLRSGRGRQIFPPQLLKFPLYKGRDQEEQVFLISGPRRIGPRWSPAVRRLTPEEGERQEGGQIDPHPCFNSIKKLVEVELSCLAATTKERSYRTLGESVQNVSGDGELTGVEPVKDKSPAADVNEARRDPALLNQQQPPATLQLRGRTKLRPLEMYEANIAEVHVPEIYREAVIGKNAAEWSDAIKKELSAYDKNSTWTLVPRDPSRKPVKSK